MRARPRTPYPGSVTQSTDPPGAHVRCCTGKCVRTHRSMSSWWGNAAQGTFAGSGTRFTVRLKKKERLTPVGVGKEAWLSPVPPCVVLP